MKKALLFLAEGFEECEALITADVLMRAGVEVTMASVSARRKVYSAHGIALFAGAMAEDVDLGEYDMIVLPGGLPGTTNLQSCPLVTDACLKFAAEGKLVAAICAAPSILGALGLLEGKEATVYPGMEDTLIGAVPTGGEVAVAGNIITGQAMGAATAFALAIVAKLFDAETARQLAEGICYRHV